MRFSEQFGVASAADREWLDIFLPIDSRLFIDPFLIYDFERDIRVQNKHFDGSHQEIVDFFAHCYKLVAASGGDRSSANWRQVNYLLMFPEVEELCLGFTSRGTGGAGSGRDIANRISNALWRAISLGLTELRHFEEVQIFETGIGPDRISDATAGILRHRFAAYTENVCKNLGIDAVPIRYGRSKYDTNSNRWISGNYKLPINPHNNKPILLTPKYFVRSLPTINADDFYDYCFDHESEMLRERFGGDIARQVPKEEIVKIAREHPLIQQDYIGWRETRGTEPYDFLNDPGGYFEWYNETREFVANKPAVLGFEDHDSFEEFVNSILKEYRNFIENNGG